MLTNQKNDSLFQPIESSNLYKSISERIKEAIFKNHLKPGDKLPSEKELSLSFNVSKASLREALRTLEAEGLIEIRKGVSGGAFVREVDLNTACGFFFNYLFFQKPTLREFSQIRIILELAVIDIITPVLTDVELAHLEGNLEKTKNSLNNGKYICELDLAFHRMLASATNNTIIEVVLEAIKHAVFEIKSILEPDYEFAKSIYELHKQIYEALCERDAEKAKNQMFNHIKDVESRLMVLNNEQLYL
jgi:DNA-binding FadR family transcriptional regulator